MASTPDALRDIMHELTAVHGVQLDADARRECGTIFDGTVGFFAERANAQGATTHPWDDERFRSFILGQVKRIAETLRDGDALAPVDREHLRQAAHSVMMETSKICDVAMERGHLKFNMKQWTREGAVCSMYLRDTMLPFLPEAMHGE